MIDLDALERQLAQTRLGLSTQQCGALITELRANRKVVEAAKRAIALIMAQPGEFTTDEVGLDDLLAALGAHDAALAEIQAS